MRTVSTFTLALGLTLGGHVHASTPLDDNELSKVAAADGISFAMHLALNQPVAGQPAGDSRLTVGQVVDGKNTYMVIKNVSGVIDMFALTVDTKTAPDGTAYVAIGLPGYVKFTNVGFESLSVQSDPRAPVTESLGRYTLNGSTAMQGQLRLWAH